MMQYCFPLNLEHTLPLPAIPLLLFPWVGGITIWLLGATPLGSRLF